MKNALFYYYQLTPQKIIKKDKYYCFEIDNWMYYLWLIDSPLDYINDLLIVNKMLINTNFMTIVYNTNREAISIINNRYYMLLKGIKDYKFDLNNFYNPYYFNGEMLNLKFLNHSDWGNLWTSKIDYFEYQKEYIKVKYKKLYKSLDYFIGLSENAISYFYATNTYVKKDYLDNLVISRRRINLEDISFYNPLNIVIDNKARDSGEYLKYLFIKDDYTYDFIETFLNNLNYSNYQYCLLMSRLLYPSFYFDIYEKIINGACNEKEINKILKRIGEYEQFLKYIYNILNKKKSILQIDWLDS